MKKSPLLILGAFALFTMVVSSCGHRPCACPATPMPPPATTPPTASAPAAAPAAVNSSAVPVSLANDFNDQGIYPDGAQFSGGIDRDGYGCSSNLLGTTQTCGGIPFQLGSINSSNVVTCQGQTIQLPSGNFSKLEMLAIAVNGAQADQVFNVNYADNSSQSFTQSLSDWAQPDNNTGESQAINMDYRLQSDGSKDENTYYLFTYSFNLNSSKGIQSIKLPDNDNVRVFALTLVP